MKDTSFEGQCPFSVSDNLKIKASSYDLSLDGAIIRYGSISGFRASSLREAICWLVSWDRFN